MVEYIDVRKHCRRFFTFLSHRVSQSRRTLENITNTRKWLLVDQFKKELCISSCFANARKNNQENIIKKQNEIIYD